MCNFYFFFAPPPPPPLLCLFGEEAQEFSWKVKWENFEFYHLFIFFFFGLGGLLLLLLLLFKMSNLMEMRIEFCSCSSLFIVID